MEVLAPMTIVLALGAAAQGAPEALRFLLRFAGRISPLVDVAICVFVIGVFTAQVLGVVLLVRFVRKPRASAQARARARAPVADCFAKMTLAVSVGVALSVSACLVAVSAGGGGLTGPVRVAVDLAAENPVLAAGFLLVVLLCFAPLLRVLRGPGDAANGGAPAARGGTVRTRLAVCRAALPLVGTCLVAAPLVRRFSAGSLEYTFIGVAAFAVVGTALLRARFSPRAGNGAGAAVSDTARVTSVATRVATLAVVVACFTLAYLYFLLTGAPGSKSNGGKHTCSA